MTLKTNEAFREWSAGSPGPLRGKARRQAYRDLCAQIHATQFRWSAQAQRSKLRRLLACGATGWPRPPRCPRLLYARRDRPPAGAGVPAPPARAPGSVAEAQDMPGRQVQATARRAPALVGLVAFRPFWVEIREDPGSALGRNPCCRNLPISRGALVHLSGAWRVR